MTPTLYRRLATTLALLLLVACAGSPDAPDLLPTDVFLAKHQSPPAIATITDLGAGAGSWARAVNAAGQIVGGGGAPSAFLWENGVLRTLGVLPGMTSSWAEDINTSGTVVGYSSNGSLRQAFIWTAAGGMQALPGSLGGCCTLARRINDDGIIVGEATLPGNSASHTVMWDGGVMTDIQSPISGSSYPWGLSNTGTAVGQYAPGTTGAFIWTAATGMSGLSGLGSPNDVALGVNDNGQIVGWYRRPGSAANTAFLWDDGVILDLGTLGGASSAATAITDDAQVCGRADIASRRNTSGGARAFYWSVATGMRDLGLPRNAGSAQAEDLNSSGLVVGEAFLKDGAQATLWKLN